MIIGIGTDITEVSRIKLSVDRFGSNFIKKILHTKEIEENLSLETIAGYYCAKEALIKALGHTTLQFNDIQIMKDEYGKPTIEMEPYKIHVSITHDNYVVAIVVIEK